MRVKGRLCWCPECRKPFYLRPWQQEFRPAWEQRSLDRDLVPRLLCPGHHHHRQRRRKQCVA